MRIIAILVVLLGWRMAGAERAKTIPADLDLDPAKAAKVTATLRIYDGQLVRLRDQRAELRRRMIAPSGDPQKLLDDQIANARALLLADELLMRELRTVLTAEQTIRALVLISASEPDVPPCDPFRKMHRCPG